MTDPVSIKVPEVITKTTKAVTATITTGLGVLTLLGTTLSDGVLTWSEVGTLIGATATAVATCIAVWRVPNEVVAVREGSF